MKRMFFGKMGSWLTLAVLFIGLALLIFPAVAFSGEKVTLKVSMQPFLSFAPFFLAIEEEYFAEQGIDLEFVRFRLHGDELPALAQGQIDVSAGAVYPGFFNAVARGMNLKSVADRGHTTEDSEYTAVVTRKELYDRGEVRSLCDLRGKKVAIGTIGGGTYRDFAFLLPKVNLTLGDVELVQLGYPETVEALRTGAVDVATLVEPLLTKAEESGVVVGFTSFADYFPNCQIALVYFGPNLLEKRRDLGRKFILAYLKGVRAYNRGKTSRNLEIIQKYTKLDQSLLKKCSWPVINDDGRVFGQSMLTYQDWLHDNGFVDTKVELEEMIDTSFIEWANKKLSGE